MIQLLFDVEQLKMGITIIIWVFYILYVKYSQHGGFTQDSYTIIYVANVVHLGTPLRGSLSCAGKLWILQLGLQQLPTLL